MHIKVYHKYYRRVCYQVVFKGFDNPVCLNHFALQQQSKVDLTRGKPAGGVVPQETTSAFGDDASTRLDHVCDDHADSKVCMCVSCVGVQCNIPQRLYIHLFENTSQTAPF